MKYVREIVEGIEKMKRNVELDGEVEEKEYEEIID